MNETPTTRLEPLLEQWVMEYRQVRYTGAAPAWPRAGRWRWRPAVALAVSAILVVAAGVLLSSANSRFGANPTPPPSPYAVLREVRQSLPEPARPLGQALSTTPPKLPQRPQMRSGFAPPEPTSAGTAVGPLRADLA